MDTCTHSHTHTQKAHTHTEPRKKALTKVFAHVPAFCAHNCICAYNFTQTHIAYMHTHTVGHTHGTLFKRKTCFFCVSALLYLYYVCSTMLALGPQRAVLELRNQKVHIQTQSRAKMNGELYAYCMCFHQHQFNINIRAREHQHKRRLCIYGARAADTYMYIIMFHAYI